MASGTIQKPTEKVRSITLGAWTTMGFFSTDTNNIRFIIPATSLADKTAGGSYSFSGSFKVELSPCNAAAPGQLTLSALSECGKATPDTFFWLAAKPSSVNANLRGVFSLATPLTITST